MENRLQILFRVLWPGRSAEFEKYFRQGIENSVSEESDRKPHKQRRCEIYTTEVIVEDQEFAESRAESEANRSSFQSSLAPTGTKY